jgi:hypothetical protein
MKEKNRHSREACPRESGERESRKLKKNKLPAVQEENRKLIR